MRHGNLSYEDALAAVHGVTVEWARYVEDFGGYHGRFVAKLQVEGEDGPRYVVSDFGSCTGCDAFRDEFGYRKPTPEHLADFGRSYVDAALTLDEAITELLPEPGQWYDDEDRQALEFVLADYPEKRALLVAMPKGSA